MSAGPGGPGGAGVLGILVAVVQGMNTDSVCGCLGWRAQCVGAWGGGLSVWVLE